VVCLGPRGPERWWARGPCPTWVPGPSTSPLDVGAQVYTPEYIMNARVLIGAPGMLLLLTACVSLAPGADKVRVTKNASDVANCSAVGNIKVPGEASGQVDIATADTEFRNQAIGFGGNAAFVTSSPFGIPVEGIAYRCP
jgi:hypothetical protein